MRVADRPDSQRTVEWAKVNERATNRWSVNRGRTYPDWAKHAPDWAKHAPERQRNGACEPNRQATRGSQILFSLSRVARLNREDSIAVYFCSGEALGFWIFAGHALKVRLNVI